MLEECDNMGNLIYRSTARAWIEGVGGREGGDTDQTGGCTKLYGEDLHKLKASPAIMNWIQWAVRAEGMGEIRKMCTKTECENLMCKSDLREFGFRWEYNITIGIEE